VISKGSVEALNTRHGLGQQVLAWSRAMDEAVKLAREGFRVLAVTAAGVGPGQAWRSVDQHLLGLVAMNDPATPAAVSTLAACRAAGMRPILITGDHPATAAAVARRVGVLTDVEAAQPDSVVTGSDLTSGAVTDLTTPRVFARTSPAQKLEVIQAWKDRGAIVAMTGDGVNDGPALRRADIGVAMGHRGTEVARQAADLILADDDLATVVTAVEEGRRVYANIRLFLVFGLSGGAAEIALMLLGPLVGLLVPLVAAQILWINLLTHGLTGVALGAEPAGRGAMQRPPRRPDQSVLGEGLWQRVVIVGAVLAAVTIGLGLWAADTGRAWQTMVFLALTSLQLGVAVGLRPRTFTTANLLLPVTIAGSLGLALAGVYLPTLQDLLSTVALPVGDAMLAVATAGLGWASVRLSARAVRGQRLSVSAPIGSGRES
jgi:Ca2+-transporting ATPase